MTSHRISKLVLRSCLSQGRMILVFLGGIMAALCPFPSQLQAPEITSVSQISIQQLQTIVISGGSFGTQSPYTGDSSYTSFSDVPRDWQAGFAGPCPPAFGCVGSDTDDALGLIVQSWDDLSIALGVVFGPLGL